jgi:fructose-specific phosphotransferase system IIC component
VIDLTITQNQKRLLERELKEINIMYIVGLFLSLLVAGLFLFLVFPPISRISLFGLENYLTGIWAWIWSLLLFLIVGLNWIKANKLTERKKEIQLRLAEDIVG